MIQEVLDAMQKELVEMIAKREEMRKQINDLTVRISSSRNAIYQYSGKFVEVKRKNQKKTKEKREMKEQQAQQQ